MYNQVLLFKKIDPILIKIDKILIKNNNNRETILKNILANIDIQISKFKNNDSKQIFTFLSLELDKKLQLIIDENKSISFYSDKIKKYQLKKINKM
jgi:hypothetical protein